jgi:trehalose 6-phosphate phosphatase
MESADLPASAPSGLAAVIFAVEGGGRDGATLLAPAVRALEQRGVRVAVIDSSQAPEAVSDAALAARGLGVVPGDAVLLADAPPGVQAGQRAGFGLIVAVDREARAAALLDSGADVVVASLAEATPEALNAWFHQNTRGLPSALARWPEIAARLRGRRPAVFLDYDGTLTPIVERPEDAILPADTRELVRRLAARCPVAIVSGRGRDKVMDFVRLDEVYYAGSHGFDISGPHTVIQWQQDPALRALLARASAALRQALVGIPGVEVEDKGFSTAVHYRRAAAGDVPEIERRVEQVLAAEPALHKTHGKKVLELRPRVDWHKGRAMQWLLEALGLDGDDVLPIYVGDDVTDEDAFAMLRERGLGILVSERPRPSAATYAVRDPGEVRELLARLVAHLDAAGQPSGDAPPA